MNMSPCRWLQDAMQGGAGQLVLPFLQYLRS